MSIPPNGNTPLLLWAVNALLGLVVALLSIMMKMLKSSVDDYRAQQLKDLEALRAQQMKDLDALRVQQTKDLEAMRSQTVKDIELHTKEIDSIRTRLHNHGNRVAEIITRMRWQEEDKSKGG